VLLLGACTAAPRAGAPEDRATADGTAVAGDGDREGGELVVYAAASLTDVAGPLADGFAASHPGVRVRFDVDGSNALAHRLAEGAPADVVALADDATMATVGQAGRLDGPTRTFARNRPAVVVPAEGGADLSSIADLARPGVRVGLCAPTVPCGKIGRRALDQAGVAVAPVTEETDVRALLARVVAGELDAGIVYRTDAIAAGHRVRTIPFPDTVDVVTTYPIAAVTGSADPALAHAFVDHVLGPDGRAVLRAAGFEAP
jgi:molybdate transport system substrate-binding protein